jgi:hypothetical protein
MKLYHLANLKQLASKCETIASLVVKTTACFLQEFILLVSP